MLWGQIQVLYYTVVILLALIINGSPLVAVLAVFVAWAFEPSFKTFVDETWGIKADDKPATAQVNGASASKAKKPASKASGETKPKTAKSRAAKPKPTPAADSNGDD